MTELATRSESSFLLPPIIEELGPDAAGAFVDFFTDRIRNPNTRQAYGRAVVAFMDWTSEHQLGLPDVRPRHVGAYIEQLGRTHKPASVKQHLAGIRQLFDFLTVRGVIDRNPATEVQGPSVVRRKGATEILSGPEARELLASIDPETVAGVRDRALIGVMIYTFGRVSAVLALDVADYYQVGRAMKFRLQAKGSKTIDIPAHHSLVELMDAYLERLGAEEGPLFRSISQDRTGYTARRLDRREALAMVKRRTKGAGLGDRYSNHSFRGTGITAYLKNDGSLETAQYMAGHASPSTTRLYDRREEEATLDEVERIIL